MSSGSKAVTVGYRYFMGLHFGLCYGPVDAVLEVRAGDRTAWSGSQTTSGAININAVNLFGGEEREGGIAGTLDVMMGEPTQAANSYLASKQTGPQPAYRGLLTAVFRGLSGAFFTPLQLYELRNIAQSGGYIGAMNPYIKPWAFRIRRISQGWRTSVFDPSRATVTIGSVQAMNPAHIIYQCLTDPEWGLGYPTSVIDSASFTAASQTLHAEGFGLCMQWTRQDTIESFMQLVANHCGAVVATDRRTGQFVMNLIRGGYTVSALPLFDETNIIELESFQRGSPAEATNEVTVKYRNPATGKDESVTVHNLANITAQGGVVSRTSSYPGLPSRDLASRVAARDLLAASSNLAKVRFRTNRSAHALLPGAVIRIRWSRLGLQDLVIRVGRVDYGTITDGAITIEGVEDVFSLPAASYVGVPPNGWQAPPVTPVSLPAQLFMEAPYRTIVRSLSAADRAQITDTDCLVVGVGARPPSLFGIGYDLQTRAGAAAYVTRERGSFTPYGTSTAIVTRTATTVTLTTATDLNLLEIGQAAALGTEIVRVTSVDSSSGVIGIARGCSDTVPQQHAAGTAFFGLDDFEAADPTEYVQGEVINGRFLTVAPAGILPEASAPVSTVTTAARYSRPYPPGNVLINGVLMGASFSTDLNVQWSHRDRITQADQLIDTTASSIGPEAGTTYRFALFDEADAQIGLPQDTSGTVAIYQLAADIARGRTYTVPRNERIFVPNDPGAFQTSTNVQWAPIGVTSGGVFYSIAYDGNFTEADRLFTSSDGATWAPQWQAPAPIAYTLAPVYNSVLIGATMLSFTRSSYIDAWSTYNFWRATNSVAPSNLGVKLTRRPVTMEVDGTTVYCITEGNIVWSSSNNGDNWTNLGTLTGAAIPFVMDSYPVLPGWIIAAYNYTNVRLWRHAGAWFLAMGSVILRTTNATPVSGWTVVADLATIYASSTNHLMFGPPAISGTTLVMHLVFTPSGGGAAQVRVLRSTNDGVSWADLAIPGPVVPNIQAAGRWSAIGSNFYYYYADSAGNPSSTGVQLVAGVLSNITITGCQAASSVGGQPRPLSNGTRIVIVGRRGDGSFRQFETTNGTTFTAVSGQTFPGAPTSGGYAATLGPYTLPRANGKIRVTLESRRSGVASWQAHNLTVLRAGYGYNYGDRYGA